MLGAPILRRGRGPQKSPTLAGGNYRLPALQFPMPELSRFLGIVIAMYYRDHGPAHFHAIYGEFEITVEIESGRINGTFPKRALTHVHEWRELHVSSCWRLGRLREPANRCRALILWSKHNAVAYR
jgi:uncharacterized protein DUF4160